MPTKNDDNLKQYPNIKADHDDLHSRRRGYQGYKNSSIKNYIFYTVLFIVLIFSIYISQNIKKLLDRFQILETRIEVLEEQLVNAGDEMNQTDQAVRLRLKELDSEVRKLWDNVWKKSKAQLAMQDKNIKNLTTRTSSLIENQSELNSQQLELKSEVLRYNSALDEIVEIVETLALDNKQLTSIDKQLPNLKDLIAEHDQRIKSNEEWIESINLFRKQVNIKLNKLTQPEYIAPQLQ